MYQTTIRGRTVWRADYTLTYTVPQLDSTGAIDPALPKINRIKRITGTSVSRTEAVARRGKLLDAFIAKLPQLQSEPWRLTKPTSSAMTFGELLDKWLAWKTALPKELEGSISLSVAHAYARTIELHLKPTALASRTLNQITPRDLREFLEVTLTEKKAPDGRPLLGSSPKRTIRNIISMAFAYAVRQEYIKHPENPTLFLPKISKTTKQNEQLEKKKWTVQRVLKHISGKPEEAYWILAFSAALRQSERLGLTWDCFRNLDQRDKTRPTTLEIRQQLARNPKTGELYLKPAPKTAAGERFIPLPDRIVKVLRAHREAQKKLRKLQTWQPVKGMENLVFTHDDGRPIHHQRDNKRWHALWDKAINANHTSPTDPQHVPCMRGHALRHIAISIMIETGTPIEIVSMLAGHADIGITRAVYEHLSWQESTKPMEDLAAKLYEEVDASLRK